MGDWEGNINLGKRSTWLIKIIGMITLLVITALNNILWLSKTETV